jgi:hypothetical protein
VPGENGYIGPATSYVGAEGLTSFDPDRYDPDDTFTYPVVDLIRNAQTQNSFHQFWWFGKLGNGSQIELGNYTWVLPRLVFFFFPQLFFAFHFHFHLFLQSFPKTHSSIYPLWIDHAKATFVTAG